MYAELAINIEVALESTFHYHVPPDLKPRLSEGHLVEVEFGRRLAQGIIVGFGDVAPVKETKPIISLIDDDPVVRPWQIQLARQLSRNYLTPLNACLRLMLPPGLTRWADVTLDINPAWDGSGQLSEEQEWLVDLLRKRGDLRGRQIARAAPKDTLGRWRTVADQLVKRKILRKASILDPPRVRPKMIKTAQLNASPDQIRDAALSLGRHNKKSEVLFYLITSDDPLPSEAIVKSETGASENHLSQLAQKGLIRRSPPESILIPAADSRRIDDQYADTFTRLPAPLAEIPDLSQASELTSSGAVRLVEQPAGISLGVTTEEAIENVYHLRSGEKYYAVLVHLARLSRAIPLSEIYKATGANMGHMRRLAELDLVLLGEEEVWRNPLADRDFVTSKAPALTPDQALVWGQVESIMNEEYESNLDGDHTEPGAADPSPSPVPEDESDEQASPGQSPILLHGVTGSGKTEIYLRAADKALQRGQRVIVLVPEIALTPQTVGRFAARFPKRVAVLHSRLSQGERYDTWRRARQGDIDIVVGPRSALFAPLERLGLIVMDEEHDHSYKQDPPGPAPYYHAREVAIELSRIVGASLIMGSATPDLVTYHQARAGRYELLELPKRIMGHRRRIVSQATRLNIDSRYRKELDHPEEALTIPLPPIQVVDLRQELRAGNRSIFSRALRAALDETLENGEQAILFLNRRGTATFIICRDCGLILKCPRCDMPLTYHRPGALLQCHHCGRKEPPHERCPNCGSQRIKYFGLGTEEVQRLVEEQWPQARTIRWDRDTTAGKDTHEMLLASFIDQEADILVGTQMIAKGLDLPFVTLVGVISADVALGLPDYRTAERAFQVLAQVAGRAGRGLLGGRVIIQTYQPEHYAIQAAAAHDYISFYLEEIRFRTQLGLPPFRRLARLLIADPVSARAERQARRLAKKLSRHIRDKELGATELLGPVPPFFSRIDGRYRWQLIVRSPDPVRLLRDFPIPADWIVDLDPMSTL